MKTRIFADGCTQAREIRKEKYAHINIPVCTGRNVCT